MTKLTLTVTIDEANLILEGLGQLPFIRVYELIATIQGQARAQLTNGGESVPVPSPASARSTMSLALGQEGQDV